MSSPPPGLYAVAKVVDGRAEWPAAVTAAAPAMAAAELRDLLGLLLNDHLVKLLGPMLPDRPDEQQLAALGWGGQESAAHQLEWLVSHLHPLLAPRWVVGAPDTTAVNGVPMCLAGSGQFLCTREPHDDAVHASGDGRTILAVWVVS